MSLDNQNQIHNQNQNQIHNHKIVFVGESAVGKSSIILRYHRNIFNAHGPSTIGAAFMKIDYSPSLKFEIWDTAGQERFRSLLPMYYRNAEVVIVCYDITDKNTFEKSKDWINEIKKNNTDTILVLVGTKLDLADKKRQVPINPIDMDESDIILHFETSSKTGENIINMFDAIASEIEKKEKTSNNKKNSLRIININNGQNFEMSELSVKKKCSC